MPKMLKVWCGYANIVQIILLMGKKYKNFYYICTTYLILSIIYLCVVAKKLFFEQFFLCFLPKNTLFAVCKWAKYIFLYSYIAYKTVFTHASSHVLFFSKRSWQAIILTVRGYE